MPTVYALISDNAHFLDAQGNPASGAKLFVYTAGSSTKATTYTESDGATANANPIVLNSRGEMPSWCYVASGTYKTVLAPSNDSDPPTSPYRTRDNLTPVNDTSTTVAQFTASGQTPTFVSTTQFTLVGDHRTEFHVGRRIKTANSAGTGYHTITAVAFSTNTTVTVANDSTALDSGLSSVDLSILRADDKSALPGAVVDEDDYTFAGNVTVSGNLSVTGTGAVPAGTAGDILYYDGSVDPVLLSRGTDGEILTLASVVPSWSAGTPTGTMTSYAGLTAPTGWLLCGGQAVSRTTYSSLFGAISITQSGVRTSGSAVVTGLSDTAAMVAGMPVSGTGIPASTTISSVDSSTQITLSQNATSSGTNDVAICQWGVGDGSTTFDLPDARDRVPVGVGTMGGTGANLLSAAANRAGAEFGDAAGNFGIDSWPNAGTGSAAIQSASTNAVVQPSFAVNVIIKT